LNSSDHVSVQPAGAASDALAPPLSLGPPPPAPDALASPPPDPLLDVPLPELLDPEPVALDESSDPEPESPPPDPEPLPEPGPAPPEFPPEHAAAAIERAREPNVDRTRARWVMAVCHTSPERVLTFLRAAPAR
jgi:hypothetical protein